MTEIPRNWVFAGTDWSSCPPATPRGLWRHGLSTCREESHMGMICTRPEGHTGRHAASGMTHILAVWE